MGHEVTQASPSISISSCIHVRASQSPSSVVKNHTAGVTDDGQPRLSEQADRHHNEELINSNAIEVLNEEKDEWSILKNNLAMCNDNHVNRSIQMTKHFFKLKMSLV